MGTREILRRRCKSQPISIANAKTSGGGNGARPENRFTLGGETLANRKAWRLWAFQRGGAGASHPYPTIENVAVHFFTQVKFEASSMLPVPL